MSDNNMGNRIRELRLSNNLTLEQVADYVGVGKSTVRKWETGIIANMKRDKIASLAAVLKTTPGYLMGWNEPSTNTTVNYLAGNETNNAPANEGKRTVTDDDIKFALFGGDGEITDEMYEEVKSFAAFVKNREANKK